MYGGQGAPAKSRPRRRRATPIVTEHGHGQASPPVTNYQRGAAPTGGPGRAQVAATETLVRRKNLRVADVQRHLRRAGYAVAVDGVWGPQTARAWHAYTGSLARSLPHDYLNYSRGAPQGEHARVRGPNLGTTVNLRGAAPAVPSLVTEHTRGQVRGAPVYRGGVYVMPQAGQRPSPTRGGLLPFEPAARGLATLLGSNVAAGAFLPGGLPLAHLEHALMPKGTPGRGFQGRQLKTAETLDPAILKGVYRQGVHDVHHPLSIGTALDAAALFSGVGEAVGRTAAAGRLAYEAERGGRTAAALGGLSRPAQLGDVPLLRRAVGHPETGTRALRVGRLEVQPPTQSPTLTTHALQHLFDRASEKFPDARLLGAQARARRLVREGHGVRQMRATSNLAPLSEAARALLPTVKVAGRAVPGAGRFVRHTYSPEEMAYSLVARIGHVGQEGVDAIDRELAIKRAALAKATKDAPVGTRAARTERRLEARIKLLEAARPHVLNPSPALMTALREGKLVADATTASIVARGAMRPETAVEAEARHLRMMHGAEFREPTPTREGRATAALTARRELAARAEKDYAASVGKVQKLQFTGFDRKRLGLKSERLVAQEARLKQRMADLRREINATPKGSTKELQARYDALEAQWQRIIDKHFGPKNPKIKGTQAEQKFANSQNRKGETVANVYEQQRLAAEREVLAKIEQNQHLPVAREMKARIAERDRIAKELLAREARKPAAPGTDWLTEQPAGAGFLTGHGQGAAPALLHPHMPTTEAALREEMRRVSAQHLKLTQRVTELPTSSGASIPLREEIRPLEKAMRAAEKAWNRPVADTLEQRAALNRILREGGDVKKALVRYEKAGGEAGTVPGIEDLKAKIEDLTTAINEGRGFPSDELKALRTEVNKLRAELRKAEKPRAHIVPGELPYAISAKGEVIHPIGHAEALTRGAVVGKARAKLATAEKRAAAAVEPTGIVTPKSMLPAHATREEANAALDKTLKAADTTREQAGIRRVVNTADMEPDEAAGAMFRKNGVAEAVHVTDNPEAAAAALRRGTPITAHREGHPGDLGAAGLHVSDVPTMWTGRGRSKWDFTERLTEEQRARLADELTVRLRELRRTQAITHTEQAYALRDLRGFRAGQHEAITGLANQPFNIPIASPEFLKRLGIEPGAQPTQLAVHLQGSFAELTGRAKPGTIQMLKDAGFDGAFTRGSISTSPELVVWNNHAVRRLGDYAHVDPHLVTPGPLGFNIPDYRNLALGERIRGRVSSLNPPKNEVNQWTGALHAEGRERVGPRATLRAALAEVHHKDRVERALIADKVSQPYDAAAFNPRRHELYDPHAAIPGRALPHGEKAAIAAEKRAALELPIEHADEALSPRLILERAAEDHAQWAHRAFPKASATLEEHRTGLKMIDKKWAQAIRGEDAYTAGHAGRILDFLNQINRTALIYLNTSYIPVQGTGNAIYVGLQHGPWGAKNIPLYLRRYKQLTPELRRRVTMEVGGGAAASLAHEGAGAGPLTKIADFQNYAADKYPRDIAWLHEANRMGYNTPAKIEALLTEPKLEPHLNVVTDRAQQAMVKFRRAPTGFRRAIGRAIFIAPWLEGSTRWIGRFIADRPFTAAVANHIRDHIIETQKKVLKGGKEVTGGFIPTAIPARLASKATFGMLPGPVSRIGGLDVIPGVNPDSISPTGSGVGVAKTLAELTGAEPAPLHGGSRLLASLQPALGAVGAGLFHEDPYSGYKYPKSKSFGGILAEQTFGSVDHPVLPAAALAKTFFTRPADLSHTKAAKLPTYYPEAGWRAGVNRAIFGSTRTKYAIKSAVAAKTAVAERAAAQGNPEAMARIKTKAEIARGYTTRNKYLAAAQKYGIIAADGELPPVVREAIRLRTIRNLNYIQHGAKTEGEKLAADAALLVRRGLITPELEATTLAWIKDREKVYPEDIASERAKVYRKFFGGKTLADASHELHKRKKKLAEGR